MYKRYEEQPRNDQYKHCSTSNKFPPSLQGAVAVTPANHRPATGHLHDLTGQEGSRNCKDKDICVRQTVTDLVQGPGERGRSLYRRHHDVLVATECFCYLFSWSFGEFWSIRALKAPKGSSINWSKFSLRVAYHSIRVVQRFLYLVLWEFFEISVFKILKTSCLIL